MTERVKLFNDYFCKRQPYYEKNFMERKQRYSHLKKAAKLNQKVLGKEISKDRSHASHKIGSLNLKHLDAVKEISISPKSNLQTVVESGFEENTKRKSRKHPSNLIGDHYLSPPTLKSNSKLF